MQTIYVGTFKTSIFPGIFIVYTYFVFADFKSDDTLSEYEYLGLKF
jgi:hypothetical protein